MRLIRIKCIENDFRTQNYTVTPMMMVSCGEKNINNGKQTFSTKRKKSEKETKRKTVAKQARNKSIEETDALS